MGVDEGIDEGFDEGVEGGLVWVSKRVSMSVVRRVHMGAWSGCR